MVRGILFCVYISILSFILVPTKWPFVTYSVLNEFKQWVNNSRYKQLDAATEKTIKELRRKVARRRWKRAINAVRLTVRLGLKIGQSDGSFGGGSGSRSSSPGNGLTGIDSTIDHTKTVRRPSRTPPSLSQSMAWMHDQRSHIMTSLGLGLYEEEDDALPQKRNSLVGKRNSLVKESEIKEIINQALEEPRFFIEGSLMSNLIESGIEVVWFGDRHPNDVVYALCCNRQEKRVSVVFRGTVNSHNWLMNL